MQTQAERSHTPLQEWRRSDRIAGWALLVCWCALSAGLLFLGEGESTFQQLKGDVASGAVTEVQTSSRLEDDARGYDVVEVHWRKGFLGYSTRVIEADPIGQGRRQTVADDVTARITPSVADVLTEVAPTVRVTEGADRLNGEVYGRTVPTWLAFVTFFVLVATVLYLVAAPRPWRATKWAWFWVLGIFPPLGVLAFLTIGGATGLFGPPPAGSRRLTGGWAFLVSLLLGSAYFNVHH